jgi:hypothetical protein
MDGKPIANKYCEGKMKRTLRRMLKDLKLLRRKRWKLVRKGVVGFHWNYVMCGVSIRENA